MRLRWLPWKFILRQAARAHGFLDPLRIFSQLTKFAQPSEVAAPVELIRAGLVFHARGLLNTKAIQNNLDWIWPFWVRRQFDPRDRAFVPRAFSITHVNLTNRNWTAVGVPDVPVFPLVDPRGLVTPFFDGWSLDSWIVSPADGMLVPSQLHDLEQTLQYDAGRLAVCTRCRTKEFQLESVVETEIRGNRPYCRVRYGIRAEGLRGAWFALAVRPYNPEGVSFVHHISASPDGRAWTVNHIPCMQLEPAMKRHVCSTYKQGDVFLRLLEHRERLETECHVGMASGAALYELPPQGSLDVQVRVDLCADPQTKIPVSTRRANRSWKEALEGICALTVPDHRMRFLYEAAVRFMILHTPLDVYPGPFTYKRFWFRDAVLILHALLCVGAHERVERAVNRFPRRQSVAGYFHSQEGEWDSNGQVLWFMRRFCEVTGRPCPTEWFKALKKGAAWILRKRLPADSEELHAGLLPAGFSAEHFGNNDYYYWDDYWAVAGLRSAAAVCEEEGNEREAMRFQKEADRFMESVERSLERSKTIRRHEGIPASPYRRMDSGAVGSMVASYPLQLLPAEEPRLLSTIEYLLEHCFVSDAFFQDMIHSGMNVYLSLHCAQVLLRAGDPRFYPIVMRVVELASPTGQWPEAIHPQTLGGCMGDGQHMWAAAEWVMMMRNLFVREEDRKLVLLQGIPESWWRAGQLMEIGPVHTRFGSLHLKVQPGSEGFQASWEASWHSPPEAMEICCMDGKKLSLPGLNQGSVSVA